MFRRYPYWGWLLLSLLLWSINGYQYHLHRQAMLPEKMAKEVNNDFRRRQEAFEKFSGDRDLIRRLFTDSLTEKEFNHLNALPFYIYGYQQDSLKYWNTNIVVATPADSALDKPVILRNEKGVFIQQCFIAQADEHKKVVILFPVLITYPLENNYLHSHFPASANIPVNTKILAQDPSAAGAYPVMVRGKSPVFYLLFNEHDLQKWIPDTFFILMLIAALLASLSWLQLMTIYITRKTSPLAGFTITMATLGILLLLYYSCNNHLPFNLDSLTFFDSKLYGTSKFLSSFGDLCILTLCFLWIVVFMLRHTPYRTYCTNIKGRYLRPAMALVLTLALIGYVERFVYIIRTLVRDSNISFDVSHFYAINIYTILGLCVIGGITGISCIVIFLFNLQLGSLITNRWLKYLLVFLTGSALLLIMYFNHDAGTIENPFDWLFYWALFGWLLLFLILLDVGRLALVSDLLEPHMVFWAIFICLFCTSLIQYFNQAKERESRIAFVKNRLVPQRDFELELSFDSKAKKIEQDKQIKSFFYKPGSAARKLVDQHFNMQYLTGTNKYQQSVYLFDNEGKDLYNKDTTGYHSLLDLKNESDPTISPYLFYKEAIHDLHQYISSITLYNDTVNKVIGYVLIDFDLKKQVSGTVYPELLQSDDKVTTHDNEYAVAVYLNDKLNSQTNDYAFASRLQNDTLKKDEYAYYTKNNILELYYKIADKRTLVVVHYHSSLIEMITLFSYLFVIQVMLASLILLYQLYLSDFTTRIASRKVLRLTLRRRVHFSMLGIVLLSFIIIGFVTILFFKNQYQLSNSDKLQSAMQVAKQSVRDNLKTELSKNNSNLFDSVTRSPGFKSIITSIANGQKIDLNIYNRKGVLMNTSEDDVYEKGLVSRIMRPDAFYKLNGLGKSILIQDETVADLQYLSAYLPLRDEQGVTAGYINVPFFSSEKDLKFQISNIVVTLINLYAFIFLISSLITVLITRWITSSFSVIIRQFEKLNLQRNERITWPYDDEIGKLVSEYNKMVNKVEENAALLAQSERESAWREMARQVAHEIKNPLTPMKLNIQFLQQAMRNDHPNIKELTEKLSGSIIEQIDNLSYIASEFSNFAKMPEARPEVLDLGELLNLAMKLYLNDAQINATVTSCHDKIQVYSDRSQLMRVFTNLLENAKQAIPEGRQGTIDVSVVSENNNAIIAIKDNGAGINEEAIEKIFQPYFTTKSSGTGLGLAMTKKIIEFWKGQIWFETMEDVGTTFYIKLPLHNQ